MKAITGMDATFLYGESPTAHMHVGNVVVLEGSLQFNDFKNIIKSRIHTVPRLRQRLLEVPFSIDYPYWVDDPYFDIDMHLQHIALPSPGGWKELRSVASKIFSEPLDRNRPLWSFTFVEGLDTIPQLPEGSVAIIAKIHHVAIDGVAGAGIMALLFDLSPKPSKLKEPQPFNPEPLPNDIELMVKSAASFAKKPLKFPKLAQSILTSTLKAGVLTRFKSEVPPPSPFSAPSTPINRIICPRRNWNTAILSLERIKVLKNKMGTTVNDIILAICAGALRRYLEDKKKLPSKSLVAMVPISTRMGMAAENEGNNLSAMLVQLATNIDDPIERLEQIQENTIRGKNYQNAMGARTLSKMAEAVPFGIANQAARLYSRYRLASIHKPVFNVVISNVPGPQFPFYLNGHKVMATMGMAPVIDGMGLIITIFSYNGLVTISSTACAKTMPDLDVFSRYLRYAANDLEERILTLDKKKKKVKDKVEIEKPKTEKDFQELREFLKENELEESIDGLFQLTVEAHEPVHYRLDLNSKNGKLRKGNVRNPDLHIHISDDHLHAIFGGELDWETAQLQGRVLCNGDKQNLKKIDVLFRQFQSVMAD